MKRKFLRLTMRPFTQKAGLNIDSPGAILDVEGANSGSADSSPVLKLFSNNNNGTGEIFWMGIVIQVSKKHG